MQFALNWDQMQFALNAICKRCQPGGRVVREANSQSQGPGFKTGVYLMSGQTAKLVVELVSTAFI